MVKASTQNTAIIIPVFQAEKTLSPLINQIKKFFPEQNIIVVNDASKDSSLEICKSELRNVIDLYHNCGKGFALQKGFFYAINEGFDFAITIDSDLQHNPNELTKFLSLQQKTNADIIIGKRDFNDAKMPFSRKCSNFLTSKILSFHTLTKVQDSQCGYRMYRLQKIKPMRFYSRRYQFETEILIKFAREQSKMVYLPIETIYQGEVSYISHLRDIINFIEVIFLESGRLEIK